LFVGQLGIEQLDDCGIAFHGHLEKIGGLKGEPRLLGGGWLPGHGVDGRIIAQAFPIFIIN
jgi:hypothetical protein